MKRANKRPPPGKALFVPPQTAVDVRYPDAGTGDATSTRPGSGTWFRRPDAIKDRADADASARLCTNWPEIADKYFLRRFGLAKIFVLLWAVLMVAVIRQDNSKDSLTTWEGLLWTLEKCGILTAVFLGLGVIVKLGQWLWGKWKKD